jgi:hypothetical protein
VIDAPFRVANGKPVCDLANWKGEVYEYALAPVPPAQLPPWASWACTFTRLAVAPGLDAGRGLKHLVRLTRSGEWTCTCKDFVCRRKRAGGETCKHVRRGIEILEWLRQAPALLAALPG